MIIEFYNLVTDLFPKIINTGIDFWEILNTPISQIIDESTDLGIFDFLVDWITGALGSYTILGLMLGSGVLVFVAFVMLRFFKL